MEHWSGEVCQLTSRGDPAHRLQWCFSRPAWGQRLGQALRTRRPACSWDPSVFSNRPHTASFSCPDVLSSHKCLPVDAVGLFWLLQTALYQGGSSRIQEGLQLGYHGEQPLPPLSPGQGYLARKEVILSSLMHSNQDLALRNQSPSFSQPWEDLAVGLVGMWQEVGCAHASWTPREEGLEAASGNCRGEPRKTGDRPNQGCSCLGDSKDSSCWHLLSSQPLVWEQSFKAAHLGFSMAKSEMLFP